MSEDLINLKGLGEKSIYHLNQIGIFTRSDLATVGPALAYLQLHNKTLQTQSELSVCHGGTLEDRHWIDITREKRPDY